MLIAQLSDVHVRPRGKLYKNVTDSNQMLIAAIAHLHGLDRRPDLVLLTGDLVDEGQADEYAMAFEILASLQIPFFVMPGNHDSRQQFRQAFESHNYLPAFGALHFCIDDYPVRIVALDSCVPNKHHGHIDDEGLRWLEATLQADPLKPTIVALHHPPFISGIPYLDDYAYLNPGPLEQIISCYSNIEVVLCGHVHRTMLRRWAGTVVATCPSTTTQIALQLMADAKPRSYIGPGACMLHFWNPPNGLVSHISYTGDYGEPYSFF